MAKKEKVETEDEKKVIQFIKDEIIKEKFLEFTFSEICKGTDLGDRKATKALMVLQSKGKVAQRTRYKNNTSFYTISYLVELCKDCLLKNKEII